MFSRNPNRVAAATFTYAYLHNVLSPEQCAAVIRLGKSCDSQRGQVRGKNGEMVVNEDVRKTDVSWLFQNDENAWLFAIMDRHIAFGNAEFYNYDLFGYELMQFGRYSHRDKGHYDGHMDMALAENNPSPTTRKLSVSVLLNDDFDGGEFQTNATGSADAWTTCSDLKVGSMVLFPSFICHRVLPVTRGDRYSLVIWAMGPKFR